MRTNFLRALLLVSLTLAVGATSASAQDGVLPSFGIRPTQADSDRPETFSYFVHTLEPGSSFTDEALVLNEGTAPITLKLYAVDGITAQNGGTTFPAQGELSSGGSREVSTWLSLPLNELTIPGGEEVVVPFIINVPVDASPGHHIAGLVVEAPPSEGNIDSSGEGETQFAVEIIQRVGVAVVIEVPGPQGVGLEIGGTQLIQQSDQGATFSVVVRNTGNVLTKGEGLLRVFTTDGEELASTPWQMDTVLPGDSATFEFTAPFFMSDGDYLINVAIRFADGQIARLDGAKVGVRDGQPVSEAPASEDALSPAVIELSTQPSSQSGIWEWFASSKMLTLAIFAAPITILAVFEIYIWRKWWKERSER
ncbi:MAG: DUF916 domain-containing protein [Chloroflexi bacterium]|nr:DUF916 domain-containing protein [Chloroflexota bacterium]